MKKFLILLLLVTMAFVVLPVQSEPPDQYHAKWKLIRETDDEDGAAFVNVYNLTISGNFANMDSNTVANGGAYQIRSYIGSGIGNEFQSVGNKWMFAFCGKNYNNVDDTFSFNVIGWSKVNGMLQTIAEGDGVLGTQAVIAYPDGGDALGELISETGVAFTDSGTIYNSLDADGFTGAIVGMMAYVSSPNETELTSGYYQITTVTDANTIVMSGTSSAGDLTGVTVKANPAFWADTINLDETSKWPTSRATDDANSVMVYNSADNEVALLVIETTGIEWIQFVIYAADAATSEESGAVTVYGRPF